MMATKDAFIACVSALGFIALTAVVSAETPAMEKGKDATGSAIEMGKEAGSPESTGASAETKSGEMNKGHQQQMKAPETTGTDKPMSMPEKPTVFAPEHDYFLNP